MAVCLAAGILGGCGVNRKESSAAEADPDYVLTYAENQTEDYATTQGAQYFAREVEEKTDGKVRIRVYADAQLGDESSVIAQLRFGGVDFSRVSMSTITDYSDQAVVLMMPYLYRDSAHMWRVLDGEIGQEVMESFGGSGLVPLSWYDAGVRSFYCVREVHSLEEMKGMSIRVQPSALMEDLVRALGGAPVPVDYEDVYSALQTGRVDAAENNWSSYKAMDHYRVASYFIEDEHTRIPELQIMSEATRKALPDAYVKVIDACARDSAEYERDLWQEQENAAKESCLDAGCTAVPISEEEKAKFRAAVQPLYEKYCADQMDLVKRIQQE